MNIIVSKQNQLWAREQYKCGYIWRQFYVNFSLEHVAIFQIWCSNLSLKYLKVQVEHVESMI